VVEYRISLILEMSRKKSFASLSGRENVGLV